MTGVMNTNLALNRVTVQPSSMANRQRAARHFIRSANFSGQVLPGPSFYPLMALVVKCLQFQGLWVSLVYEPTAGLMSTQFTLRDNKPASDRVRPTAMAKLARMKIINVVVP